MKKGALYSGTVVSIQKKKRGVAELVYEGAASNGVRDKVRALGCTAERGVVLV